jgi:hypothetical protein
MNIRLCKRGADIPRRTDMATSTKTRDIDKIEREVSRENTPNSPVVQALQQQTANAFVLYARVVPARHPARRRRPGELTAGDRIRHGGLPGRRCSAGDVRRGLRGTSNSTKSAALEQVEIPWSVQHHRRAFSL